MKALCENIENNINDEINILILVYRIVCAEATRICSGVFDSADSFNFVLALASERANEWGKFTRRSPWAIIYVGDLFQLIVKGV